jgi:hypothetical protein
MLIFKNFNIFFKVVLMCSILFMNFLIPLRAENSRVIKNFPYAIEPIFETVNSFVEGLAAVKINHNWGFIDKSGKVVIAPQFNPWQAQFNSYFSEGLVAVNFNSGKDEKNSIDANDVQNLRWGFADKNGKVVIPPVFMGELSNPPFFSDGLASVMFSSAFPKSQLLMSVSAKYGYINQNGDTVIEPTYDKAFAFVKGLALVEKDGKYGFINKNGEVVIPLIYDSLSQFSEDLSVASLDKKYFLINKRGNRISSKNYDFLDDFSEGLAKFTENGKFGFIDKAERIIIRPIYQDGSILSYFGAFRDGLFKIEFGFNDGKSFLGSGKFGYIDKSGKVSINPIFDSADDFKAGKAVVEKDGKHFFINKKGERISQYFDDLGYESDGMIKFGVGNSLNRKYGFIRW